MSGLIVCQTKLISDFIKQSSYVHGYKYDYSQVKYVNSHTKVDIICNNHGMFKQLPYNHLRGKGCVLCGRESVKKALKMSIDDFIFKSNQIHNNKYDYSKSKYINNRIKLEIICFNHGIFKQTPTKHLGGDGCPSCSESKGEKRIAGWLLENNIEYERQKRFSNLKKMPFDFYLNKFNLCIEFDGKQHFEPISKFGGKKAFLKLQNNDQIKNTYCKDNNINLLRIHYKEYKNIYSILNKFILNNKG